MRSRLSLLSLLRAPLLSASSTGTCTVGGEKPIVESTAFGFPMTFVKQ